MAGNYWIFKTEPSDYSWSDLVRDKRTAWTGVRSAPAQKHLRSVAKDDDVLIYHTGSERAIVGLARVARAPYPDPSDPDGKYVTVDVAPVRPVAHQLTLGDIKADPAFKELALVRIGRLSVVPVTPAQWKRLIGLASG
jgi:predicted RNA-binding protein with PUA-like domain